MAVLVASVWIPAFAGMTVVESGNYVVQTGDVGATIVTLNLALTCHCNPMKEEGIRWLVFVLDFGWRSWLEASGFPLSRE